MPFKIGDRVRLIEDYAYHKKGEEGVVTKVYDSTHSYANRVSQQLVCCNNMLAFDFRLELVPAEPHFEVGKKYRFKYSSVPNWIIEVTQLSEKWMICTDLGGHLFPAGTEHAYLKSVISSWEEYIPEPPKSVHKEGWVRVYMDRTIRDKVGSILYDTENEALQLTSGAALKGRSVSGVRAFKIEWDEAPEASEDDTI